MDPRSSSNMEAPSPASANPGPIDETAFADLARLCGAELPKLVRLHLQDARRLIDQMRVGLATRDFDALRRAAHTLKASAAMFGATELSRRCGEAESAVLSSREPREPDFAACVARVDAAFAESFEVLIERSAPPSLTPPSR